MRSKRSVCSVSVGVQHAMHSRHRQNMTSEYNWFIVLHLICPEYELFN
jgi:hypothetical protein